MNSKIYFWKFLAAGLLLIVLLLVFPFISNISFSGFKLLRANENLFGNTLARTILFAVVSGFVLALVGFWGAILLTKVPAFSKVGKNLSVLILPVTLGNISIAFISKLLIGDSAFFAGIIEKGVISKLGFLLLLQLWQFGLLFIYLFWMQFQSIPANRLDYATANRFSFFHTIKDIYLPHTKNLWILMAALGMVFSLYEESKIQYLFKASQGTNSELITNWLGRNYQSSLLVNPGYATKLTFQSGWVVFLMAVLSLAFLYLLINALFKLSANSKLYPIKQNKTIRNTKPLLGTVWGVILIGLVLVPLIASLLSVKYNFSAETFALGFPLLMAFIAAVFASVVAVFFGVGARLGWKQILSSFNNRSLFFFILIFLLLLIPPVVILISGYKWMALLGYTSLPVIYTIWILGHVLLSLPVLGSFVLFNHFRVSNNELNYLSVYQLSKRELLQNSFIKRFRAEYLLLFIIGFSFIWNEAILNNLFSDYIPSFVSGLKMLITGRGADYSKAFGYLLVSLSLAISAVAVWRYIIHRAEKWSLK